MQKFTKPFKGVPNGAIYPIQYAVGDECPPELEAGARSLGAIDALGQSPTVILNGSDLLPAHVDLAEGKTVQLGEVVARAHVASGVTPEAWNALSAADREYLLAAEIEKMKVEIAVGDTTEAEKVALQAQLEAAGIKFDKRWGLDKLRAALAEGKKD